MLEGFKKIDNPLTVIGIFAGVSEISMGAVAALSPELRPVFLWFVVLFPPFLISLFFITLNFNHKVLYAPSDYRDDSAFVGLARASTEDASKGLNEALEKLEAINTQLATSNLEIKAESDGESQNLSNAIKEITENVADAKESVDAISFDHATYPDMTWGQWRIIAYLYDRVEPTPITQVATDLKISHPKLSRDTAYLREQGLLIKEKDGPKLLVFLTDQGRAWAAREVLKYVPVSLKLKLPMQNG